MIKLLADILRSEGQNVSVDRLELIDLVDYVHELETFKERQKQILEDTNRNRKYITNCMQDRENELLKEIARLKQDCMDYKLKYGELPEDEEIDITADYEDNV